MVQTTTEKKEDTAKLFRDDAHIMADRPSAPPVANLRSRPSPLAQDADDEYTTEKFDPNGNSDQAILLRRSGYRITDEKTAQGLEKIEQEKKEEKTAERIAMQRAAIAANAGFIERTRNWISNAYDTASNWVSDTYNSAKNAVSDFVDGAVNKFTAFKDSAIETMVGIKDGAVDMFRSAGTAVSNGFNSYIYEPAASVASWGAKKVSDIGSSISGGVSSAYNYVFGGEEKTAQTAPARQEPQAAPRVSAEAQPLTGQKNDVSSGFSLSGAFDSAVDGAKDLLGWSAPAPKPAPGLHR